MPKTKHHPAEQYAMDVISKKIPACTWVIMACKRHRRDLREGSKRGLYFDRAKAALAIEFFTFCNHSKGEWSGQPFVLSAWQMFCVWVLFGWMIKKTGFRRFRTAYIEVPKKNGKSTWAAALGNLLFIGDKEPGAEVYAAATKRDQAKIVWSEAKRMVETSPVLLAVVDVLVGNMNVPATYSKFEPLSSDTKTMDGPNIHAVIIDEVHAHKNREIIEKLQDAGAARRQPIQIEITTAGIDRLSICYDHHSYTEKILEGSIENDGWFGIIYTIDENDDWTDPKSWAKANPNLGVCPKIENLEMLCLQAQDMPSAENSFKRLRLNIWTEQINRWIKMALWNDKNANPFEPSTLLGRPCYGGLDLAQSQDIAAYTKLFPPVEDSEKWKILTRYYIPEECLHARVKKDDVPYDVWAKAGLLTVTEGNVIDHKFIEADIIEDAEQYLIQEIAYDRMFATQIIRNLGDEGLTMVPFGQGFYSMAAPCKEFETMLLAGLFAHNNDKVLKWMASNVTVKKDPADNMKPDKANSHEKIDGIVALLMALGRAIVGTTGEGSSVYDDRGIISV